MKSSSPNEPVNDDDMVVVVTADAFSANVSVRKTNLMSPECSLNTTETVIILGACKFGATNTCQLMNGFVKCLS